MIKHITAPAPRMLLRLFQLNRLFRKQGVESMPLSRVCEIGPGLGDACSLVLDKFKVAHFDLYESAAPARELLAERFGSTSEIRLNAEFKAEQECYDMIMAFEVIEHIDKDITFLDEIFRSINSGGRFFGSVPAYVKKWQSVDELAGHFRRYERDELREKLETAGFIDIEIHTYGFPLINLLYPWREYHYAKLLAKRSNHNKQEATAKSGISRGLAMTYNKSMVYTVVRLFSFFQSLPGLSRFGDGFIFTCKKP